MSTSSGNTRSHIADSSMMAQTYIDRVKTQWLRKCWQLRQVHVPETDRERYLEAFDVLHGLASHAEANLRRLFVLLGKELFDEVVKIVALTALQKEQLHKGSSNTSPYIMTFDEIALLTRALEGTDLVASYMDLQAGSSHDHDGTSADQSYAYMRASLNQWSAANGRRAPSVPFSPSQYAFPPVACNGHPRHAHTFDQYTASYCHPPRRRGHLRSTSDPSLMVTNAAHVSPATLASLRNGQPSLSRGDSLDVRTTHAHILHLLQSPKPATDHKPFTISDLPLCEEPSAMSAADVKIINKGKEIERWLTRVEQACDLPSRKVRRFDSDISIVGPPESEMQSDSDDASDATTGGEDFPAFSALDNARSRSFQTPPLSDCDDDKESVSGGSDSSWNSTIRDRTEPVNWEIVVHPEWVRAAQAGRYIIATEIVEIPWGEGRQKRVGWVWLRVLRAVTSGFCL